MLSAVQQVFKFVLAALDPLGPLHLLGLDHVLIDAFLHTLHRDLMPLLLQQLVEVQTGLGILNWPEVLCLSLRVVPGLPLHQLIVRKQF